MSVKSKKINTNLIESIHANGEKKFGIYNGISEDCQIFYICKNPKCDNKDIRFFQVQYNEQLFEYVDIPEEYAKTLKDYAVEI